MKLKFNITDVDYSDSCGWQIRRTELESMFLSLQKNKFEDIPISRIMDNVEELIELMQFYALTENLTLLKPIMTYCNNIISNIQESPCPAGMYYIRMKLGEIDSFLYKKYEMGEQLRTSILKTMSYACECYSNLYNCNLKEEQIIFLLFQCSETLIRNLGYSNVCVQEEIQSLSNCAFEMLNCLWEKKDDIKDLYIRPSIAIDYLMLADVLREIQKENNEQKCRWRAASLFHNYANDTDELMFYALEEYALVQITIDKFILENDQMILTEQQSRISCLLNKNTQVISTPKYILNGINAILEINKVTLQLQKGDFVSVIEKITKIFDILSDSIDGLLKSQNNNSSKLILQKITTVFFSNKMINLSLLGTAHRINGDSVSAQQTMKEVLRLLDEEKRLSAIPVTELVVRATAANTLAEIALEEYSMDTYVFYCQIAASSSQSLCEKTKKVEHFMMSIINYHRLACYALNCKKKSDAKFYAVKGLEVLSKLSEINYSAEFEKYKKEFMNIQHKAERRLF